MTACPLCGSHDLRRGRSDYAFCLRCGLAVAWALTPQKVESTVYNDPDYYQKAGYCSPGFEAHYGVFARILAERLPERAAVLEIGCGIGSMLWHLSKMGHDVCGMDLSPHAKRIAAERYQVPVVLGNAERDPIPLPGERRVPQCWDMVIMSHTLEHFFRPVETMQKVADAMIAGGWWFNLMPDLDQDGGVLGHVKPWEHVCLWGRQQIMHLGETIGMKLVDHYQRTSAGECVSWLQKAGDVPERQIRTGHLSSTQVARGAQESEANMSIEESEDTTTTVPVIDDGSMVGLPQETV